MGSNPDTRNEKTAENGMPFDAVMTEGGESFWRLTRKEFRKNRPALYSLYVLAAMAMIALTADLVAGNKPYYMVYEGETYFPAFRQYAVYTGLMDWPEELRTRKNFKRYAYSDAVFPIIPYARGRDPARRTLRTAGRRPSLWHGPSWP